MPSARYVVNHPPQVAESIAICSLANIRLGSQRALLKLRAPAVGPTLVDSVSDAGRALVVSGCHFVSTVPVFVSAVILAHTDINFLCRFSLIRSLSCRRHAAQATSRASLWGLCPSCCEGSACTLASLSSRSTTARSSAHSSVWATRILGARSSSTCTAQTT